MLIWKFIVRKRAKIRNRYNQAPNLTQDTNGKATTSQLDIPNESQKVSPIPGDHKAFMHGSKDFCHLGHATGVGL